MADLHQLLRHAAVDPVSQTVVDGQIYAHVPQGGEAAQGDGLLQQHHADPVPGCRGSCRYPRKTAADDQDVRLPGYGDLPPFFGYGFHLYPSIH